MKKTFLAYSQPPGCSPVANNLATCQNNLNTCEDGLAECEDRPPAPLAQTGQITCWDPNDTEDPVDTIPCAGSGQDGEIQAGVVLPNPRFADNGNGTITDLLTGLIWLKNGDCFGFRTWGDALQVARTLNSGECGLSDGSGEGDWYLPNRWQLQSLLDLENIDPALPNGHPFVDLTSSLYWTSTTDVFAPRAAWLVNFNSGFSNATLKTNLLLVLPVREGP